MISIQPLDMFFLVILLLMVIRGLYRGFVQEFGSVASVFLGILAAVLFSGLLAPVLDSYMGESMWNQVIAFLVIFLLVYVIVKISEAGLRSLIERSEMENLDRALGFFMGIIEGALVIFILLFVLYIQPLVPMIESIQDSVTGQLFLPLFPYAANLISGGAS